MKNMEDLSALLFKKLCRYIGTREQVYLRRKMWLYTDKLYNESGLIADFGIFLISSGSRAEGLNLPGSDIDVMFVRNCISVLPTSPIGLYQPDLIMEMENVKPGFCRLRVTDKFLYAQIRQIDLDSIILAADVVYFSSLLFNTEFLRNVQQTVPNCYSHGPCATERDLNNIERDNVACLACSVWPDKASEWIHRRRPNNWPPRELVQSIVSDGCLLVPIGNPNSDQSYIEWRISFSSAEKKLVYSMNHTQLICYGLLKLYLKHVIESEDALKNLLCSYFLKTCLFYCIEGANIRWIEQNLIICFWTCFKQLFTCVRQGNCPNYFIKDNNMFEGKILGERQAALLRHLSYLYSNDIDTFLLIPSLRQFLSRYQSSFYSIVNIDPELTISDTEVEYLLDHEIFSRETQIWKPDTDSEDILRIMFATKSQRVSSLFDLTLKYRDLYISNVHVTQVLYHKYINIAASNKGKYRHLKMLQRFILHECTHGDICTGWLQYATLCYITGQYNAVLHIVKHVLNKLKSITIYQGPGVFHHVMSAYIMNISGRGLTTLQKMKLTLARTYLVINFCRFIPREIEYEIIHNSYYGEAYIPPLVYSIVLLFLVYKALGLTELGQYALNTLYVAAGSDRFITELERPIVSALISRCVQLGNDV